MYVDWGGNAKLQTGWRDPATLVASTFGGARLGLVATRQAPSVLAWIGRATGLACGDGDCSNETNTASSWFNRAIPQGTRLIQRWNASNGPGPLGEKVAGTFRSGSYSQLVTTEPTTLYRVWGGKAGQLSTYWSRTVPSGPVQAQLDSAILPEWQNTAMNVTRIQVPAGTTIYEGAAASQNGILARLLGGGNQV